ncbi:chorismate transformation enzyme, FkbO/Hyg5 family, partial [Rubrivivax gelatinosus]
WGPAASDAAPGLAARLLAPAEPVVDLIAAGPAEAGRLGPVRWRDDGHWLSGWLDLPDAGTDLTDAAFQAYRDLFRVLASRGRPPLAKVWNFLPRINDDGGGMERYRQFNVGRFRAFSEAGFDAFEGAPAACALGTHEGTLSIRFLASRGAVRPLDNPRQVAPYRYSNRFGPRSPNFSRAALAEAGAGQLAFFVSGTAAIVGERSMHEGDVLEQLAETLRNLDALCEQARAHGVGAVTAADLDCVVYLRHAADLDAVRAAFEAAVGPESPAARRAVYVEADVCRRELLVEIEGHALIAGALTR